MLDGTARHPFVDKLDPAALEQDVCVVGDHPQGQLEDPRHLDRTARFVVVAELAQDAAANRMVDRPDQFDPLAAVGPFPA